MSETLRLVIDLVERGEVKISEHGYEELAADGIFVAQHVKCWGRWIVGREAPEGAA